MFVRKAGTYLALSQATLGSKASEGTNTLAYLSGGVFTTLYFPCNIRMGQIS